MVLTVQIGDQVIFSHNQCPLNVEEGISKTKESAPKVTWTVDANCTSRQEAYVLEAPGSYNISLTQNFNKNHIPVLEPPGILQLQPINRASIVAQVPCRRSRTGMWTIPDRVAIGTKTRGGLGNLPAHLNIKPTHLGLCWIQGMHFNHAKFEVCQSSPHGFMLLNDKPVIPIYDQGPKGTPSNLLIDASLPINNGDELCLSRGWNGERLLSLAIHPNHLYRYSNGNPPPALLHCHKSAI